MWKNKNQVIYAASLSYLTIRITLNWRACFLTHINLFQKHPLISFNILVSKDLLKTEVTDIFAPQASTKCSCFFEKKF